MAPLPTVLSSASTSCPSYAGRGSNAARMARRPRVAAAAAAGAPAPWHGLPHEQRYTQQQARPCTAGAVRSGRRGGSEAVDDAFCGAAPFAGASAAATKFDRILRFVEQHDLAGPCAAAATMADVSSDGSWHVSYDEEAEEGCEPDCALPAHEAAHLAAAAASLAAGPACSVAFLYPSSASSAQPAAALGPAVGTLAYFAAKPLDQSYDEEAEGCFEAAAAEAAAMRAARLESLNARRAESRAAGRMRRAGLTKSVGALESMPAWVDDVAAVTAATAAKTAAGRMPLSRYPHLAAFLAARTGAVDAVEAVIESLQRERGLQARPNQSWVMTFDEDVHGALSSM